MGTHTGNVITLANSIIGVSVLAMPFCFKQCGIFLSILMLLFSNVITRLACYYLMKSAIIEKRKNFEMLAFRAFGPTGKLIVELCIIGFMLGTCVAYFVIMGDLGPAIIGPIFGFEYPTALRPSVLIGIAAFVVLPLGLLRNVDSLSAVCAASIAFYFCFFLKVIGEALNHFIVMDWIDKVYYWRPSGILQCIPIFSMALFCQTQLFEIFDSLPSTPMDRMNGVVRSALNMVTLFYISVGFFGYVAYCDQSFSGNLMMNFSPTITSDVIKIGFLLSVAVSFPLVIFPCRASIHSLCFNKGYEHAVTGSAHIPETRFKCITLVIVTASLVAGLLVPNIEIVLGLVGSTIGVIICVIIPGITFLSLTVKNNNERLVAKFLVCVGLVIMVLGTYANLYATEEAVSGPEKMSPSRNPAIDKILNVAIDKEILKNLPDIKPSLKENEKVDIIPLNVEKPIKEGNLDINKDSSKEVLNRAEEALKKDTKKEPPVPEEPVEIKSLETKSEPPVVKEDKKSVNMIQNIKEEAIKEHPEAIDVKLNDPLPKANQEFVVPMKDQNKETPQVIKNEEAVVKNGPIEKADIVKNDPIINLENNVKHKGLVGLTNVLNGSIKVEETNKLKENLIEKIKEHEQAQKKLNEEGVKLLQELKEVVKNENNSFKLVNVKTGAVTDIKNKPFAKSDLENNEAPKTHPEETHILTQKIVQGIPLPLVYNDKDPKRIKDNEAIGKSEVGRDILEVEKEVREKRDVDEVLKIESSQTERNENVESVSSYPTSRPLGVVRVTEDKLESKAKDDSEKVSLNYTSTDGILSKLKSDLNNCLKNNAVKVPPKVGDMVSNEKKMDDLIKSPSYLSNSNSILNGSPQLLPESGKNGVPDNMPKKRDLKSLGSQELVEGGSKSS